MSDRQVKRCKATVEYFKRLEEAGKRPHRPTKTRQRVQKLSQRLAAAHSHA